MTPHIEAKKDDIAKKVIMPGDPLRAKMIAEKYLENPKLVNDVRGMLAYTGTYKGKKLTIMASGMGMPSMGIYSYELFKFYDVDTIIRVGSCGAYTEELNLYDLILVESSYSKSTYAEVQNGTKDHVLHADYDLNEQIKKVSDKLNFPLHVGNIYSSDVFYNETENISLLNESYGCLGVEMESFALFHNANACGKKATCLLTVSDNLITKEETTSEERQNAFTKMIELALEAI